MRFSRLIILSILLLSFVSCKKEAGPGGLATIRGKVFGTDVTVNGNTRATGYIGDVRVFISVANNPSYFDDIRTSYDGSYEFKFLREGRYDVWAFSDCDTCAWKQRYDLKGIEITSKRQTVDVEDINIIF
jgi:hypothetical protein